MLDSWRAVDPEACRVARACACCEWTSSQPGCYETADGSAARVASSSACNLEGLGGEVEEGRGER